MNSPASRLLKIKSAAVRLGMVPACYLSEVSEPNVDDVRDELTTLAAFAAVSVSADADDE